MNITTAIAQANRNNRALNMKAEGYYTLTTDFLKVEVYKPGNTNMMPDYTVNRVEGTCDCPDAAKGNYCKHQMFVELQMAKYPQAAQALQEAKDEEAAFLTQAAQWEEEEANV